MAVNLTFTPTGLHWIEASTVGVGVRSDDQLQSAKVELIIEQTDAKVTTVPLPPTASMWAVIKIDEGGVESE